jgi:hypothetical protein
VKTTKRRQDIASRRFADLSSGVVAYDSGIPPEFGL